jgi:ribosomal protection tetracycline resistance protein
MHSLNLGILAHVDAGKTSLTERLLYDAGVIDVLGGVDAGTTRTDSMDLERRRGITIRSAVTSFTVGHPVGVTVNVVDTPGHPDFIAEVERALAVLDAAVLVLSAVEGVQPQTVVIWRALRRLGVPTLLFVNKVDRGAADPERVLRDVRRRLDPHAVSLSAVQDVGTARATVRRRALRSADVVETIAEVDRPTLDAWAEGRTPSTSALDRLLRRGVAAGELTPVLAGSALTGAGVADLTAALTRLLPEAPQRREGPPSGAVFKIERDERGRRVFVRLWSGEVAVRQRLRLGGRPAERITGLEVSEAGGLVEASTAPAGRIAVLRGLEHARIGDTFGEVSRQRTPRFAPPTLEAVVEPVHPEQRGVLYTALTALAEQDPLIALRSDDDSREIAVSLFGEVQKEVIAALLADDPGIEVAFRQTRVVHLERVVGSGHHVEVLGQDGNPYLATVGLRVDPAPVGSGVRFDLEVERGSMPRAFFTATEAGARAALRQGRWGWAVTDGVVTMTHSGYWARQGHAHQKFSKASSSVAADFRHLAQVVVTAALRQAGTVVCEPVDRVDLEVPTDVLGPALALLGRLGGHLLSTEPGAHHTRLLAHLPSARHRDLATRLPDLAGGEAVLVSGLDHHRPVHGEPPCRPRTGPDPGDREGWFRDVPR